MKVADILRVKGSTLYTVQPEEPLKPRGYIPPGECTSILNLSHHSVSQDDDDDDDEGSDVLAMLIPAASVSKNKPSAAQCVGSFPKSMQVLAIDHRLPLLSS